MTLKEYRKKRKLTLKAFADLIGVKYNSVWYYENGRVPKPDVMARIKKVTNNWVKEGDFYE